MKNREENYFNKSRLKRLSKTFTSTAVLVLIGYIFGFFTSSILLSNSQKTPQEFSSRATTQEISSQATSKQADCSLSSELAIYNTTCSATPVPPEKLMEKLITELYNGTSPYAGFPPQHIRGLVKSKRLKGWGSTSPVFKDLIRETQPRIIIEVGTFLGASAIHMSTVAKSLGLKPVVLCIDDFRGWPGFRRKIFKDIIDINGGLILLYQFMQNVVAHNLTGSVMPVPFSSVSALRALCEWGVYGDLVEVDAAHDFLSAWNDINAAYALVKRPGGVIFGHDYHTKYDNHGVRRAVTLFAKLRGLRVEPRGEHWVLRD